jgi:translation elongation factor EF-G
LLNMSDPCVEVSLLGNGEHVIGTAGELHLEVKKLIFYFFVKCTCVEMFKRFKRTIRQNKNLRFRTYRSISRNNLIKTKYH